jgi:hypothetical protein
MGKQIQGQALWVLFTMIALTACSKVNRPLPNENTEPTRMDAGPDMQESGPDMQESSAVAAFEAFVAAHQDCDTVADCTWVDPGCPLGCGVAVNTASAAEVEQEAQEVRAGLRPCVYRCATPLPLACEDSRCGTPEPSHSWTKTPDSPLSGRVHSLVAAVGDTIVVAGGWEALCPPGADCVLPENPPFADGAAYDASTGQWKFIADAPVGLRHPATAVVGDDIYALSQCESGPTCPAGRALLRYRSGADEWDQLPGPDETGSYGLVAVADGVVAFNTSDEGGARSDHRFIAGEDRWAALPDDPLPLVYDRFVVEYEGRFLLFGTPSNRSGTKLAAVYDPQTAAWRELAESGTQGYQVWRADSLLYLNPHFRAGGGGIYDPGMDLWRPLPDPPHYDLAGIIGDREATYEYASGWVLDTRTGDWLEIAPRPVTEVFDEVVAEGPDLSLVVFGGQTWASGDGQLVNDMWLWTPPMP